MNNTLYSFSASTLGKKDQSMADYQGKVLLVVNTASKCGFTPQYAGLEELYRKYKDDGLMILGFPCNQFGNQEPGDETSIKEGCLVNYGVTFPMFAKVDVNGAEAHPIFQWLKDSTPAFGSKKIKWNFTKFLVDREGRPVKRFAPTKKPASLEPAIRGALGLS